MALDKKYEDWIFPASLFPQGDAPYEDSPHQYSRQRNRDDVISVYEIYVKDEEAAAVAPDGKADDSSLLPGIIVSTSGNQPIQGDCVDLAETLDSERIRPEVTQLVDKLCDKILDRNPDETFAACSNRYPNHIQKTPGAATLLVDKDDPRSRLHFVKYLKREGKTMKIWECGMCSKEFRHQYTLMRHLPTHTDERNFKCETCGKAFRQLSTLSQHRAIHSDARPYVCEYCKKTFNRVSTLISHRKTHSDDKPHKCQMCGKGFHQKGNLRNHVFTHTNERPYKCKFCGKGFNQMSNLMCHKVKSHGHVEKSLPYSCSICGKEFLRRFALRSHEEYKHGIKYSQQKSTAVIDVDVNHGTGPNDSDLCRLPTFQNHGRIQVPDNYLEKLSCGTSSGSIPDPATAEDLKLAGNMSLIVSPRTLTTAAGVEGGAKTVQTKVPVVATVTQTLDSAGNLTFFIEPPADSDQDQEIRLTGTRFSCPELGGDPQRDRLEMVSSDTWNDEDAGVAEDCCTDLLRLAGEGADIQYVRATEDGRFEMITNSEAIDLMAENSHDVTILNDVQVGSMTFDNEILIGESSYNRIDERAAGRRSILQVLGSGDDGFPIDDICSPRHPRMDDLAM